MRKRHWQKFNFAEWRSDPLLAQVSRAARSLWLDLCGLIYEADDGGRLTLRGTAYTNKQLGAALNDDPRTIAALLKVLGKAGVYSLDPDGTIYCRRIRRESLREDAKKLGKIGADVDPEVHELDARYSGEINGLQNQNATQNQRPDKEPLLGSLSGSLSTNVVLLDAARVENARRQRRILKEKFLAILNGGEGDKAEVMAQIAELDALLEGEDSGQKYTNRSR